MLNSGRWRSRRALFVGAVLLWSSAVAPAEARAQWREASNGVARAAAAAEPLEHELAGAVRSSDPGTKNYVLGGAVAGMVAGFVAARLISCADCMLPPDIGTLPMGGLVGAFVGAHVWEYRFGPFPRRRTPEPGPQPGLVQYMIVGAAVGGAASAGMTYSRRCTDCSASHSLARNVPVGTAVGAIGGALVYGARSRGR